MRILFLARSLEVGGAERQLGALAAGLGRRGHEVAIAVFYAGGALEAGVRAAGVPVVTLDKRSRWDLARFTARALGEIRRFRPDVVHGYLVAPNLLAAAARPLMPRARIVWGLRASDMDWSRYGAWHEASFAASRIASRFADLLICNSEAGARYHARAGFPESALRVVHNGIDLDAWRPDPRRREETRARWGFGPADRVFGIAARLDPMKDHVTFLEAAVRVAAADDAARFVAIGGGVEPYVSEVTRHPAAARLAGRLVWAGETADMLAAYNALDALVLSSAFGEGFPNAVAEAMACGVPCAVTDVGDAALVVGDVGAVVPVKDHVALASAMMRVAGAASPRIPVAAARDRIASRFSIDAMVDASEALLEALVRSGD
jgi:glycosyltransferase involved in cell wall biosynthesis